MRLYMRYIEGAFFLISIVVLIVLLGLRFKCWRETNQDRGPVHGIHLISSDLMTSTYEETQTTDTPAPYFSFCNANPARGSTLFGLQSEEGKGPLWYERFLDAHLARIQTSESTRSEDPSINKANYHLILNHTAHALKNMLIECRISSRTCTHAHFVKHVLPSGVCYTFRGEIKPSETMHLELDPESVEYLIPNSGLVGFRFLVHETPKPHWVHQQKAVFLGAQFHTMLRLVGTRKVYGSKCIPHQTWETCIEKCLLSRIHKECGCIFSVNDGGCSLSSISSCSTQLDILQDSLSLSTCNCIYPCEQIAYTYESITQAWQPYFPGFRGLWKFQPIRSRSVYNQSNLDTLIPSTTNRYWFHSPYQPERDYQLAASIQMWAFLREANRKVFRELMSLDEALTSLQRISKVMQRVVKILGQAANYSRGRGSRLINSAIFDENCLDQAEHTGMLAKVSQLSETFTKQLQESFLFDVSHQSVQLNLVMIFLQRSPVDFSRLLSDLRIGDLISDVTVLDIRRNGQKCLDTAYSLNGLLNNFTISDLFPRNTSFSTKSGDMPHGNENIISSLQAMLLATDSNLNKLSAEFSRLYDENRILMQEMRGLLTYQSSMDQRHSRVAVTVQVLPRQSRPVKLKPTGAIFTKNAELLDILTSVVMVGSLLVLLAEGICTTFWKCRLRAQSRSPGDLFKRRLTAGTFVQHFPSSISPSPLSQQYSKTEEVPPPAQLLVPQRRIPSYFYSLPRGNATMPPTYAVKWNQTTLARPHKLAGQFFRQSRHQEQSVQRLLQQHQQQPFFLDITESTSGINMPSTSTQPPSDVV